MKVNTILFSSLAFLGAVKAQDYNSLPSCGKDCISNLLGLASTFGCTQGSSNEANCLCSNSTFALGIRDCSQQHCGSAEAPTVINYGVAYCSSAGVVVPTTVETVSSGTASPTGTGTGTAGAGSSATGASGVAISTSSGLVTVTSDGSTITTSTASTIFSSETKSGTGAGASATSAVSSALSSGSSAASAASSKASSIASSASSAAGGSSSSEAFAPRMTAAPAGLLAAAGLAAMLI